MENQIEFEAVLEQVMRDYSSIDAERDRVNYLVALRFSEFREGLARLRMSPRLDAAHGHGRRLCLLSREIRLSSLGDRKSESVIVSDLTAMFREAVVLLRDAATKFGDELLVQYAYNIEQRADALMGEELVGFNDSAGGPVDTAAAGSSAE